MKTINKAITIILFPCLLLATAVGCNKTTQPNTDDQEVENMTDVTEMENAMNKITIFHDSVVYAKNNHPSLVHHYDSIFHHHDSVYNWHHTNYHHHDTTHHHSGWHHTPAHHTHHDSVIKHHHIVVH